MDEPRSFSETDIVLTCHFEESMPAERNNSAPHVQDFDKKRRNFVIECTQRGNGSENAGP